MKTIEFFKSLNKLVEKIEVFAILSTRLCNEL